MTRIGEKISVVASMGLLVAGCTSAPSAETHQVPVGPEVSTCKLVPHWLGWNSLRVTVSDPALQVGQRIVNIAVNWGDGSGISVERPESSTAGAELPALSNPPHKYAASGDYMVGAGIVYEQDGVMHTTPVQGDCLYEAAVTAPGHLPIIYEGP